jgi:AcrR family transcriptional regulator
MHQAEKRALTRARLIESALEVFCDRGYEAATVDDISRAAKLSKGAFYFHFSTKEDVFLELLRTWAAERTAALKLAVASAESPREGLASMLDGLFRQRGGRGWSSLVLQFWVHGTRHVGVGQQLGRSYRLWSSLLASAVGSVFAENDLATVEEAALAILATCDGLVAEQALAWSRGRSPMPQRAAALAWSVLAAMDAEGARLRSEGVAALNAAAGEPPYAMELDGDTAGASRLRGAS